MPTADPRPAITAAILAEGPAGALDRLLQDLRRGRRGDPRQLEILVVAGAGDERLDRIAAAAQARVVSCGGSPAARRDAAWREARAPLVLFVAAGGRAGGGFVEAHLRCWEGAAADVGIVAGPIVFPGSRALDVAGEAGLLVGFRPAQVVPGLDWSGGGNLSVRRDLLAQLGGFDQGGPPGIDDVDLGLRARQGRWRTAACPAAALQCAGTAPAVVRSWRWGRLTLRLATRRPELTWTDGPRLVPISLGLLGLCLLVAGGRSPAAALGLWAASFVASLLATAVLRGPDLRAVPLQLAGRALAALYDLAFLGEALRRRHLRALWSRPVPAAGLRLRHQAAQAGDWTVLAVVHALALLALAGVVR